MHYTHAQPSRIGYGLLLTAVLHLFLLHALLTARAPVDHAPPARRPAILWLRPEPVAPRTAMPAQLHETKRAPTVSMPTAVPLPQPTTLPSVPPTLAVTPESAPAPTPALPSAAEILRQAKHDLGQIDRDLRREYPQHDTAPPDTPHARLVRGIEAAHDAVPPKWYEGARTVELSQPNSLTHVFKVSTALLTYCITIDAEGHKTYSNCP